MKTRFSKRIRSFCVLCLAVWAAAPQATAQTGASLGLRFSAGHATLTITGTVGTAYAVQYVTKLSHTNSWITLTNLTLTNTPIAFLDSTTSTVGNRFYRLQGQGSSGGNPTNPSPATLVWIPPGTFTMGSPPDEVDLYTNEGPQTMVTISQGFLIGKCPVTQQDYLSVVGSNPSYFTPAHGSSQDLTRPVETVSWHDATNYCALRTRQERAAGLIAANHAYRLPTEAEWEYACRAGTMTAFYYGDDPSYTNLANYAWYGAYSGGNSGGTTQPVGLKLPNPWGL